MKQKHYATGKLPEDWGLWIWLTLIALGFATIMANGQTCTIGNLLNTTRGDTIECTYYPDHVNPYK